MARCEQILGQSKSLQVVTAGDIARLAAAVGGKGVRAESSPGPPEATYRLAVIVCGLLPVFCW